MHRVANLTSLAASAANVASRVGQHCGTGISADGDICAPVCRLPGSAVSLATLPPGVAAKMEENRGFSCNAGEIGRETDCLLEGDGFELPVREHRATAPSHGFAAASHREAALRGAPASHGETAFRGAAGFREARRRHAVHPSRNTVLRRRAGRQLSGPRSAPPCGPPIAKSGRAKT
jgi:hypothetical protein